MTDTLDRTTTVSPDFIRAGGLAGVAFGVSVILQNLWSQVAAIHPANDAPSAEILEKFRDNAGAQGVLTAWVAVNLLFLAPFLAGAYSRLRRSQPMLAMTGLIGGVMLIGFFSMLNVPRVALALGAESWASEPALVDALWDMHLATFAFSGIALGIALVGFSLAAVRNGLAPAWFRIVGPFGGAVIILSSIPVHAGADGSPIAMAGGLGFLSWLVFLIVFGLRLWREPRVAA